MTRQEYSDHTWQAQRDLLEEARKREEAKLDPETRRYNRQLRREQEKRRRAEERRWNVVYKLYDKKGRLLYVGISVSAIARLKTHCHDKNWFRRVHSAEFEHVRGRQAALARERELIEELRPEYNVTHNEEAS
jgi:predicted GIY-YIG superfamily endonuclease